MTNYRNRKQKEYREALIKAYGGCCELCGSVEKLEFAHVEETDLKGIGRGRKERFYDILKNPLSYRLWCRECHALKDGRKRHT